MSGEQNVRAALASTGTVADQIAALMAAAAEPGADAVNIADQLTQISGHTADIGDSLAAQQAVVDVLDRAAPATPDARYLLALAKGLHTLMIRLEAVGRLDDAEVAAQRAGVTYPQAAAAGADVDDVVQNMFWLAKLVRPVPDGLAIGLAVTQSAVSIRLAATPAVPDAGQQEALGDAYQNLTARLIEAGRLDDATGEGRLAVTTYAGSSGQLRAAIAGQTRLLQDIARTLSVQGQDAAATAATNAVELALNQPPAGPQDEPPAGDPAATPDVVTALAQVFTLNQQLYGVLDGLADLRTVLTGGGLDGVVRELDGVSVGAAPGQAFCGWVDPPTRSPLDIQTESPSGISGRWVDKRRLTFQILSWRQTVPNAEPPLPTDQEITEVITAAVTTWSVIGPPGQPGIFTLDPVRVDAAGVPQEHTDIIISFSLDAAHGLGEKGGVQGTAALPPPGPVVILLDAVENWSRDVLRHVVLHEVGHALGLNHDPHADSVMFPRNNGVTTIDPWTAQRLVLAYPDEPQHRRPDHSTTARPAMAMLSQGNPDGTLTLTPCMVWKGVADDERVYFSKLALVENPAPGQPLRDFVDQTPLPVVNTSHAPALVAFGSPTDPRFLMAWKGRADDPGLYWAIYDADFHPVGAAQNPVRDEGTTAGPALAILDGRIFMAWRGPENDPQIYWAEFDGQSQFNRHKVVRGGSGSNDGPRLVAFHDTLFLFWKGVQGDNTAFWSKLTPQERASDNPQFEPQRHIFWTVFPAGEHPDAVPFDQPIGTTTTPGAAVRGDVILLAWKGADDDAQIWLSLFDGDRYSGQVAMPGSGTSVGPAVLDLEEFASGQVLLAWKGADPDDTLYWKHL